MKVSELSKRKKFKSVAKVLSIAICFTVAFSLVTVETTEAILGIVCIVVGAFVAGAIIGYLANEGHDKTSPDGLVTSQANYVLVWNDFVEEWNNDYISENVNLANYMMMYNLTFLDSVRRAEHDVASYVNLLNWSDVESNMSSLSGYKENVSNFIVSTLHGYNRIDVSILQHMYDTDVWAYTTPMKRAKVYTAISTYHYDWRELNYCGTSGIDYVQYKAPFGTHPVGYDGNYDVGDKFFVTFLYVPSGYSITLKNLDSNVETTYNDGVHDLQGKRNEVIDVDVTTYPHVGIDNTRVYLFGLPTDFDILVDTYINYNPGLTYSTEPQSIVFESEKFIKEIGVKIIYGVSYEADIYLDGVFKSRWGMESQTVTLNEYASNITIVPIGSGSSAYITRIQSEGYIYSDMNGGLKVVTDSGGTSDVTDNLPDRGRVGLDWMVNSYKNIYDAMIINSKILWNVYHANGWYSTDDIPSEFIVVAPDMIFDNLDVLKNLPMDKAQAIYYAWMAQLINFYDENPDYADTYDDTDMTVFDDGIIINASLVHGGKTVFTNHLIYISPLLNDFYICKDNFYNLTQKIFIYDITGNYIYYGYVGDNLTVHNITIDDVGTDCVTLGRQTMHDFLMGKYGFSISFPAEWIFPVAGIPSTDIYATIAVAFICLGVPIWLFAGKKYNKIGILLVVIGGGILIYIYVLPIIIDFFDSLVFWD